MKTTEIRQETDLPDWLSLRGLAAFMTRNIPDMDLSPRTVLKITEELLVHHTGAKGMVVLATTGPGLVGAALVSGVDTPDPTACIAVEIEFRDRGIETTLQEAVESRLEKKLRILASPALGIVVSAPPPERKA